MKQDNFSDKVVIHKCLLQAPQVKRHVAEVSYLFAPSKFKGKWTHGAQLTLI